MRIEGQKLGTIISPSGREATVALGDLKTTIPVSAFMRSPAEAERHRKKISPTQAVRSSGIIDQDPSEAPHPSAKRSMSEVSVPMRQSMLWLTSSTKHSSFR